MEFTFQHIKPRNVQTKTIPRFLLDTDTTLGNRMIYDIGAFPKYAKIDLIGEPRVWSLMDLFFEPLTIQDILNRYSPRFDYEDIFTVWTVSYRGSYQDFSTELLLIQEQMPQVLQDFPLSKLNELDYVFQQRDELVGEWGAEQQRFAAEQQQLIQQFSDIDNVPEQEMEEEESRTQDVEGRVVTDVVDLYYIFDKIRLGDTILFASLDQFQKIRQHDPVFPDWTIAAGRIQLLIQIANKQYECQFVQTKNEILWRIMSIPINLGSQAVQVLSNNIPFNIQTNETRARYRFNTKIPINQYVLGDLIVSAPWIRNVFVMNDKKSFTQAQETRTLYFIAKENNRSILVKPHDTLTLFQFYAEDDAEKELVLALLKRLLTMYKFNRENITRVYENLGITIEQPQPLMLELKEEEVRSLSSSVPDMFQNYARRCQLPRPPIILDERERRGIQEQDVDVLRELEDRRRKTQKEELPQLTNQELINKYTNLQQLTFPKEIDQDIFPQQTFICNHPDYPYPGLVANQSSPIGFQPCCFKKDQSTSRKMKTYYAEEKQDEQTNYIIRTDKIIPPGQLGFLPVKSKGEINLVHSCFQVAGVDVQRVGVEQNQQSFLSCVLLAKRLDRDPVQERLSLLERASPVLLKQEMYDYTLDGIRDYLNDPTIYLDPLKTIRLLEYVYQCNILLFVRDEESPQGSIQYPRHKAGHVQWERDDSLPTVMVYVHTGSESNQLKYPQCELLIPRTQTSGNVLNAENERVWYNNTPGYLYCWRIYDAMGYQSDCVEQNELKRLDERFVLGQSLDEYGKVRFIRLQFEQQEFDIGVPPLPPMNVPIIKPERYRHSYQRVVQIGRRVGTIIQDKPYHPLVVQLPNLKIYFYYKEMQMDDLKLKTIENERLSRYLTNWIIYLYAEAGLPPVEDFIENYITIEPEYRYERVSSPLFQKSGGFFKNGMLIVSSKKLLDRLLYQLNMLRKRNPDAIQQLAQQTIMNGYYTSIYDFETTPQDLVLYATDNIKHLYTHDTLEGHMYTTPINQEQFFLINPLFGLVKVVQTNEENVQPDSTIHVFITPKKIETVVGKSGKTYILYRIEDEFIYGLITPVCSQDNDGSR